MLAISPRGAGFEITYLIIANQTSVLYSFTRKSSFGFILHCSVLSFRRVFCDACVKHWGSLNRLFLLNAKENKICNIYYKNSNLYHHSCLGWRCLQKVFLVLVSKKYWSAYDVFIRYCMLSSLYTFKYCFKYNNSQETLPKIGQSFSILKRV